MALIEFKDVRKVYEERDNLVHALDGVSFKVEEGDFVAIMGPSGSGKSTLLSILGVLNTPTDGEVVIDGIHVYDLKPEKQADFRFEYLGFVFQSYQLIPYLTAQENVMIPLSITKMSGREQQKKAAGVLERVDLTDLAERLPSKISGGESQRIAIARAIVNNPPILLADEPTGNLDSKNGREIMNLLKTLNEGGQTILMVTHDRKMAQYADRTLNLMDGRIHNIK